MKKLIAVSLLILTCGICPTAQATIGTSVYLSTASEPHESHVPPFEGEMTLLLWSFGADDISGLQFRLEGSLEIVEIQPLEVWVNEGTLEEPYLLPEVTIPCIWEGHPRMHARIIVRDTSGEGGTLYFAYTQGTEKLCYRTCGAEGAWGQFDLTGGFSSVAEEPIVGNGFSAECGPPSPITAVSWGAIKSKY